jgi:hypothetical protein
MATVDELMQDWYDGLATDDKDTIDAANPDEVTAATQTVVVAGRQANLWSLTSGIAGTVSDWTVAEDAIHDTREVPAELLRSVLTNFVAATEAHNVLAMKYAFIAAAYCVKFFNIPTTP